MRLDLTGDEAAALLKELDAIIENSRYPLSPRIRVLRRIRDKLPGALPSRASRQADYACCEEPP